MLTVLVQAALTKYHKLGGLSNTVLEAGSLRSGYHQDQVPGEGLPSGVEKAVFSLYPYMVESTRAVIPLYLLKRALILLVKDLPS